MFEIIRHSPVIPASSIVDVTASPFFAPGDGSSDDSGAVDMACDALRDQPRPILYFPGSATGRTYRLNGVSLNGLSGLTILGDGAGFFDGNPAAFKTRLMYNGVGGSIFEVNSNTEHVTFENLQLCGPTQAMGSISGMGMLFKDDADANNLHWQFKDVVFAYLNVGSQWGVLGGHNGNQYLWTHFNHCSFWSCVRSLFSQATNVQQIHLEDCQMANGWERYIYATAAFDVILHNQYLGQMGPAALCAIEGPMVIKWFKGWSEISHGPVWTGATNIPGTEAVPLLAITVGGSNPTASNILVGVEHRRHGDTSGYSIYNDGAHLDIVGGSFGGKIRWDSRQPWNRVQFTGSWIPCIDSDIVQTVGSSTVHPWIIGAYSGTPADFYIEMVTATTFRYKKGAAGAWSVAIPINYHVNLIENLVACFGPGLTWTATDQWKFPCSPCGLENMAGFKPEGFIGTKNYLSANLGMIDNALVPIFWNVADDDFQDEYGSYEPTTGVFTCMFPGRYVLDFVAQLDTSALATGVQADFILTVQRNGVELFTMPQRYPGNAVGCGTAFSSRLLEEIYLNQNDKIRVLAKQSNAPAQPLELVASGNATKWFIGKVNESGTLMP
jgi:hypothetical protein